VIEQILQWHKTAEVGLPPTDAETVFVGRNGNGFCGCFNEVRASDQMCFYLTAEDSVTVMSDLTEWARLSQ